MRRVKLTLVFIILTLTLSAQTATKSYNVDIKSGSIETLLIDNQYGSITVISTPSTTGLIQVVVEKSIKGMEESRAEKYLNKITLLQKRDEGKYSVKTSISADLSTIPELQIDYSIKIPTNKRLNIRADFCDVVIDSITDVVIDLNSGSLTIDKVEGVANNISLKNTKAILKEVDGAALTGQNASVSIENSNSLNIGGEYFVAKVDTSLVHLELNLEFGGLISNISNVISGAVVSGKVKIQNVPSKLEIVADRSKVEIQNGMNSSYTFDCQGAEGRFLTPNSQLKGVVGEDPTSSVKISADQGEVKIL